MREKERNRRLELEALWNIELMEHYKIKSEFIYFSYTLHIYIFTYMYVYMYVHVYII